MAHKTALSAQAPAILVSCVAVSGQLWCCVISQCMEIHESILVSALSELWLCSQASVCTKIRLFHAATSHTRVALLSPTGYTSIPGATALCSGGKWGAPVGACNKGGAGRGRRSAAVTVVPLSKLGWLAQNAHTHTWCISSCVFFPHAASNVS